MSTLNIRYTVAKPMVMLREFFGLHDGQKSADFVREVKELPDTDKAELTELVADHYSGNTESVKKFGITTS
jgi:hypothetical protein